MAERTPAPMWVSLALALGGIVVLLVGVEALSFGESQELRGKLPALVRDAERSTYLIGHLGHRLSRLHANVLEALTEPRQEVALAMQRATENEAVLRDTALQIPQLLSPPERELWGAIEPEIEHLTRTLMSALSLLQQGHTEQAEELLDGVLARARDVFAALDRLFELNQSETTEVLERVDQLLDRAGLLQLVLAVLLFTAILVIAGLAVRTLRRKERELALHTERLEKANHDLEAFAGRVAHDLRNVLAPLEPAGRMLALSAHDPDAVADVGAGVERVARRAGDLITRLLAFSRAGGSAADGVTPLDDELAAVREELAPLVARVGAEIEIDVEPGLRIACQPSLLHIVLLNLLSNAVKFLDGRPRRRVSVRARARNQRCLLEIADTGPGIPAAALERVFDPFYRVPGVRAGGEGLGLATVRRIVEAHRGEIRLHADEGVGATFAVWLPLAAAQSHPPVRSEERVAASEGAAKHVRSTSSHA